MSVKPLLKLRVPDPYVSTTKFLVAAIAGISGMSLLASPAAAIERAMRTACIDPIRGEELCELTVTNEISNGSDEPEIFNITWQDGNNTKMKFLDASPFIQLWDFKSRQWIDSSSIGSCWGNECIHFPTSQFYSLEKGDYREIVECSSPIFGDNSCQVEYVPETDGLRVYWPDGSLDHYLWPFGPNNNPPQKWNPNENDWVEVEVFGICAEKRCLFFTYSS
jgi:hypothetical protein